MTLRELFRAILDSYDSDEYAEVRIRIQDSYESGEISDLDKDALVNILERLER